MLQLELPLAKEESAECIPLTYLNLLNLSFHCIQRFSTFQPFNRIAVGRGQAAARIPNRTPKPSKLLNPLNFLLLSCNETSKPLLQPTSP